MPVRSMRGSLSPRQNFEYSTSDSRAWSSSSETVSPQTYQPILVAAEKKDTGALYYMVKSKTKTRFTAANRLTLAAFGAAGAYYAALLKTPALITQIRSIYSKQANKLTFRNFVFPVFRAMFENKDQSCTFSGSGLSVTIHNVFTYSGSLELTIDNDIINKFNSYLNV